MHIHQKSPEKIFSPPLLFSKILLLKKPMPLNHTVSWGLASTSSLSPVFNKNTLRSWFCVNFAQIAFSISSSILFLQCSALKPFMLECSRFCSTGSATSIIKFPCCSSLKARTFVSMKNCSELKKVFCNNSSFKKLDLITISPSRKRIFNQRSLVIHFPTFSLFSVQ